MRRLLKVWFAVVTFQVACGVSPQEGLHFVQSVYENRLQNVEKFKYLQTDLEKTLLSELESLLKSTNITTSECFKHLSYLFLASQNGSSWAYRFFDAWGKFPSGIMWGNLVDFGNFDECLRIEHRYAIENSTDIIRGQYCLASIPVGNFFRNNSSHKTKNANLKLGICIPNSCQSTNVNSIINNTISTILKDVFTSEILKQDNCVRTTNVTFEIIDWVAIAIFSFVGILICCSTAYDIVSNRKGDIPNPILSTFSLKVNLKYLFHTTSKKSPNTIHCLYGIRCMSIIWVIFGHAYMMSMFLPNINTVEIIEWTFTPFSMVLQSGTISVDTFFFLSGLLLVWTALQEYEKNGRHRPLFAMYCHRYIRLTPVVAAVMLFFVSIYRYMGNGPLWNNFTGTYKLCHKTWWSTLLYIQNYAAAGKMCIGHTWYLAVDMQLFILSPLIIIPIYKWKKKAIAVVVTLLISLTACVICTIIVNNFSSVTTLGNLGGDNTRMQKVYYSTHSRAVPWLIGIIFGYFFYNKRNTKLNMPMKTVLFGWMLAISLVATVIFSLYPRVLPGARKLTVVEGAFYLALSRLAWPLLLSWVVYACVHGCGGFANTLLSWKMWQPMSKLSYSMYITHLIIQTIHAGRIKVNLHFSNYDMILRFWGDFGITLIVSVLTYLMFESPLIGLEKAFRERKQNKSTGQATTSNQNICFSES